LTPGPKFYEPCFAACKKHIIGTIDFRGNAVQNICSNLNQGVTRTSLNFTVYHLTDSVYTSVTRRLELPGFVFNEFLRQWNTQNFLPNNISQFTGRWKKKCKHEILKTRNKEGRFWKSVVITSVRANDNTRDIKKHRLLKELFLNEDIPLYVNYQKTTTSLLRLKHN